MAESRDPRRHEDKQESCLDECPLDDKDARGEDSHDDEHDEDPLEDKGPHEASTFVLSDIDVEDRVSPKDPGKGKVDAAGDRDDGRDDREGQGDEEDTALEAYFKPVSG